MRLKTNVIVALLATLFLPGCSGCEKQDDHARLVKLIENAASMAEKHDIKGLMQLTTDDFVTDPQKMDRQS